MLALCAPNNDNQYIACTGEGEGVNPSHHQGSFDGTMVSALDAQGSGLYSPAGASPQILQWCRDQDTNQGCLSYNKNKKWGSNVACTGEPEGVNPSHHQGYFGGATVSAPDTSPRGLG